MSAARSLRTDSLQLIGSVLPVEYTPSTAPMTTYIDEPHGFGFTYDDARFSRVDDARDPRLAAAWSSRIANEIAASVLFTLAGCTAGEIATGSAYSILVTTDSADLGSHLLGAREWDDVMREEAANLLAKTGADSPEAAARLPLAPDASPSVTPCANMYFDRY